MDWLSNKKIVKTTSTVQLYFPNRGGGMFETSFEASLNDVDDLIKGIKRINVTISFLDWMKVEEFGIVIIEKQLYKVTVKTDLNGNYLNIRQTEGPTTDEINYHAKVFQALATPNKKNK